MQKCRNCEVLTCIDCHKDFPGDAYKQHTSCISEEEKYSAKGWQPKANANKGAKKQSEWLERLQALIEDKSSSLDHDVKQVLDTIQGYDNIPRKRQKFINFCKNVLSRKFSPATIDKTWEVFEEALKPPKATENSQPSKDNGVGKENGVNGCNVDDKEQNNDANDFDNVRSGVPMFKGTSKDNESKKRKINEEEDSNMESPKKAKINGDQEEGNKFDWIDCVLEVLIKKGSTKMKKLQKKVINEYMNHYPDTVKTKAELSTKLEKKLKKSKKLKINNDVVSISTSRDE